MLQLKLCMKATSRFFHTSHVGWVADRFWNRSSDWLGLRKMDSPSRSAGAKLLVEYKADINAMLGKLKQTLLMKASCKYVQTLRFSLLMLSTFDMCGFVDVTRCHVQVVKMLMHWNDPGSNGVWKWPSQIASWVESGHFFKGLAFFSPRNWKPQSKALITEVWYLDFMDLDRT